MAQPAKKIKVPVKPTTKIISKSDSITNIKNRNTEEIVIGLCGPAGAGASSIAKVTQEILKSKSYTVNVISLTAYIKSGYETGTKPDTKILQTYGNSMRKKHGNYHLAELAIKDISTERGTNDEEAHTKPKNRRHATIIENFKHPDEVELLKLVYGSMFYLIGVLCHEDKRLERITKKVENKSLALEIIEKDEKEDIDHGQQTSSTLKRADYFVRNESSHHRNTKDHITRFIDLVLGENKITPSSDEFGMYLAESTSRLSGCMSRQVGAAILSNEGDIIAVGRNDAPVKGGGLYCEKHKGEDNNRCMNIDGGACKNDEGKDKIFKKIKNILENNITDTENISINAIIEDIKKNTEIKNLLEYSRAVHAEMDAITTAARNGLSVKDSTLYTSTFPCHHCARHIVSSGIIKVVYIEPYEKSLAKRLHSDAIDTSDQDNNDKVPFRHFQGVAPRNFLQLFYFKSRKKNGSHIDINTSNSLPKLAAHLDSVFDREAKTARYSAEKG